MSDNAMISIYPLGKKYFCFYESPFIQHVDPITLETIDRLDLNKKLGIFSHASHPHYDHHGNMFTMGLKVGIGGPEYVINQFPKDTAEPFENGRIIAKVRPRWIFEPGYMHSFAITENYIILIEQPLTIDVMALAKGMMIRVPNCVSNKRRIVFKRFWYSLAMVVFLTIFPNIFLVRFYCV